MNSLNISAEAFFLLCQKLQKSFRLRFFAKTKNGFLTEISDDNPHRAFINGRFLKLLFDQKIKLSALLSVDIHRVLKTDRSPVRGDSFFEEKPK